MSSLIANIGAGTNVRLFTGGALEAQLDVANADQKAAITAFGLAVLTAFREVENALENERLFAECARYWDFCFSRCRVAIF